MLNCNTVELNGSKLNIDITLWFNGQKVELVDH